MKLLGLILSLLSFSAFAGQDSVAFFYRPEKVVVLINERLESGKRLNDFLDNMGAGETFEAESNDGSISFSCGRARLGTSCRFIFTPGNEVKIQDRALVVFTTANELGLSMKDAFGMKFAGSMNDRFSLQILEDGKIEITGSKLFPKPKK